jgi:hypothetical protein
MPREDAHSTGRHGECGPSPRNLMDNADCARTLAEIEAQFLERNSALGWTIARELADFTVAFITAKDGQLAPAGTGTLVSFRDSHYFLTARHVWEREKARTGLESARTKSFPMAPLLPHPVGTNGGRTLRYSESPRSASLASLRSVGRSSRSQ